MLGVVLTILFAVVLPRIAPERLHDGVVTIQRLPAIAERARATTQAGVVRGATTPVPSVSARASGVWDPLTKDFLHADRIDDAHPIASVTKLMTALVALEHGLDLGTTLTLTSDDNDPEGSRVGLATGSMVSVRDLLGASLVGSANNATEALVRATGVDEAAFVRLMNDRAASLGMSDTRFTDVTGLGNRNTSTVRDLIRLALAAFAKPEIASYTSTPEVFVADQRNGKPVGVRNTNILVGSDLRISAGKTGYTEAAQGVLVARVRGLGDREVIVAVLESAGRTARFIDVRALADWTFANHTWSDQ
ncbi:MAG: D-alanyl-D-alanine carboxypeptidase [Candidatus Kerfeldbacteria bacterium]|nr:D-alanyl-D-alanine carboxypeptidase [Candidatus Kerfeldbacteria bacterium]